MKNIFREQRSKVHKSFLGGCPHYSGESNTVLTFKIKNMRSMRPDQGHWKVGTLCPIVFCLLVYFLRNFWWWKEIGISKPVFESMSTTNPMTLAILISIIQAQFAYKQREKFNGADRIFTPCF